MLETQCCMLKVCLFKKNKARVEQNVVVLFGIPLLHNRNSELMCNESIIKPQSTPQIELERKFVFVVFGTKLLLVDRLSIVPSIGVQNWLFHLIKNYVVVFWFNWIKTDCIGEGGWLDVAI